MDKYTPSETMQRWSKEGRLNRCRGLSAFVGDAIKQGWTVAIDLGADGEPGGLEAVNSNNVRYAVHEVDEAMLFFIKKGEPTHRMLVIAENNEDWCADYTVCTLLDELAQKHVSYH